MEWKKDKETIVWGKANKSVIFYRFVFSKLRRHHNPLRFEFFNLPLKLFEALFQLLNLLWEIGTKPLLLKIS